GLPSDLAKGQHRVRDRARCGLGRCGAWCPHPLRLSTHPRLLWPGTRESLRGSSPEGPPQLALRAMRFDMLPAHHRVREKGRPKLTKDNAAAARDLAGRFWEGLLALEPMIGTYIGDDRYDDRLPDPSDDGVAARKAFMEKSLAERSKIDAG